MTKDIWLLWRDGTHSPYFNMAADELLQGESVRTGRVILRFYEWNTPSVSFGYSQSPDALPERARNGFTHVRRPTGGGIVFHDDDLTYTLAIPPGHAICSLDRIMSYKVIHEAVTGAVAKLGTRATLAPDSVEKHDRATLQCFVSPSPGDVMGVSGKLAGAAQRRGRSGILHQGSISNAAAHGHSRGEFIGFLADFFAERFQAEYLPFEPTAEYLARTENLARLKYSAEAWNRDKQIPEGAE